MTMTSDLLRLSQVDEVADKRVALVGTQYTVSAMQRLLRVSEKDVSVVGCVLLKSLGGGVSDMDGVKVLGGSDELDVVMKMHRIEMVLVSLPIAMRGAIDRITVQLDELGVGYRFMPTLDDQLGGRLGRISGSIDPSRLIERKRRKLNEEAIRRTLRDKVVLITGGGGSIGSEIVNIVARYGPRELVIVERTENNLFEIERQIRGEYPSLAVSGILADVCKEERIRSIFDEHKPDVIFHAAAHKHVPVMEDHPREAVENNFFGTKSVADAAAAVGAEKFVMISTDKAVNPTSVMGATKRLAELYVQYQNGLHDTDFTMVRFGNVLGSACSVIPIWTKQLANGGPLTVTDPRMTRFFMTIPEAAALVIQAASLEECGGNIMLLDMGEPINIMQMAERFVRAQGLEVDRDIAITITGARPGEKMHEELAYGSEDVLPTEHEAVRRLKTAEPNQSHVEEIVRRFGELRLLGDGQTIIAALQEAIPEMRRDEIVADTEVIRTINGGAMTRSA